MQKHTFFIAMLCFLLTCLCNGNTAASDFIFTTLAGSPGVVVNCKDDTVSAAQFSMPCGETINRTGKVYVSDSSNHIIRKGAVQTVTATNGACGSNSGATLTTISTTNLCSAGTASTPTGSGPWYWTCGGANGGITASCSAYSSGTPTTAAATSKAKIYLGSDDFFTISNSGVTLYGGSGVDSVTITDGASAVTLDQNIERITFSGESGSYAFKQTGNKLNVFDSTGATLLVSVPVQGDTDGTVLSFSNGTASALLTGGVMKLGGVTVHPTTATTLTLSTTTGMPTPATTTKAKIYLGADDSFTISNSGATLYGGSGSDIVTISEGVSGVTLDQNVERINFSGSSGSYTFKQTGNKINVYDGTGGTLLVSVPVQGDSDGTVLSFSDRSASALLSVGVMALGGTTVSATAAIAIASGGTSGVTIEINTAQTGSAVRDLFGVNKNPRAAEKQGSSTILNVASLYQQLGVSQVRVHDSGVDLCGSYKDATLYDMTATPPAVLTGTCTTTGVGAPPQLKWNVNPGSDVNNPDNYDFTEVDRVIANVKEAGAGLYLRLGQTYNGPSDTDDPDAWAKVAVNIYKHIIGQFKPSGVSMDPVAVEVYNEPDGGFWKGSKGAFMTYFNNTVDGIRSAAAAAEKSLRIGGAGFTNEFVTHSATTSNVASTFVETATLARLDFLSAHHYNGCANATLARAVDWFDSVRSTLTAKGYPQSKPLDITEYNIGLGIGCGNAFFSETQVQSFASGMLTLMQQVDEWNIERALFYAGFPIMGLITNSTTTGSVTVNPGAWALWAHSQLKGGTQVKAETCVSGSACVSGKSAASSPVIALATHLSTGGYRIVVTNMTAEAKSYTLNLKGLTGSSTTIQVRTPPSSAQTVATTSSGSEYTPTASSIAGLMAKISSQSLTLPVFAGAAQTTLSLPAWTLSVIEIQ